MLSVAVYRQLAALVSGVHELTSAVEAGAPTAEIELRAHVLRGNLDSLAETIGSGARGPFSSFRRHVGFLLYYHRQDKPQSYAGDLADLRERDLPGVIDAVEQWMAESLDPGLVEAVNDSWEARQYGTAVRDAFIYLEQVLRDLGGIDPSQGLSGARLVTAVLNPSPDGSTRFRSDSFLGQLTAGEVAGANHLVRGAFLLIRNAAAHRPIAYSQGEADDIIHLVSLCLRILPINGSEPRG